MVKDFFVHGVLAPIAALRPQIVPGEPDQAPNTPDEHGDAPYTSTQTRLSWAHLLKRVFAIDMAPSSHYDGPVTPIATIDDPAVIAKILAHPSSPQYNFMRAVWPRFALRGGMTIRGFS